MVPVASTSGNHVAKSVCNFKRKGSCAGRKENRGKSALLAEEKVKGYLLSRGWEMGSVPGRGKSCRWHALFFNDQKRGIKVDGLD
jgi:hypothetical protein